MPAHIPSAGERGRMVGTRSCLHIIAFQTVQGILALCFRWLVPCDLTHRSVPLVLAPPLVRFAPTRLVIIGLHDSGVAPFPACSGRLNQHLTIAVYSPDFHDCSPVALCYIVAPFDFRFHCVRFGPMPYTPGSCDLQPTEAKIFRL